MEEPSGSDKSKTNFSSTTSSTPKPTSFFRSNPVKPDYSKVVKIPQDLKDLFRAWESAKALFDRRRIDDAIKGEMPLATKRSALLVMTSATLFLALVGILVSLSNIYFANFMNETLSTALNTLPPVPVGVWQALPASTGFNLTFAVITFIAGFVFEGVIFFLFRALGSKATFWQQFQASAIVAAASSMASTLVILTSIPCLNLFVGIGFFILLAYLALYVRIKAYAIVHQTSFASAFSLTILMTLVALAFIYYLNEFLAKIFSVSSGI